MPLNFQLLSVESLEIVILAKASELLVAVGACKILGVDAAVKANGLATAGALYLVVVLVAAAVAIAIAIIVIAAAVAVTIAVAIVVVAAAIAVAIVFLKLVKEVLLNCAKILVDLLNVVIESVEILVDLLDSVAKLVCKVKKSSDKLALCGCLVEIKTVSKTLDVCSLFGKCHDYFLLNI